MKWEPGRQEDIAYEKLKVFQFSLGKYTFDCYFLKYKGGTELPFHTDPIKDHKHYRINVTLKGDSVFFVEDKDHPNYRDNGVLYRMSTRIINFFRPDIQRHGLKIYSDTLKLSLGLASKK